MSKTMIRIAWSLKLPRLLNTVSRDARHLYTRSIGKADFSLDPYVRNENALRRRFEEQHGAAAKMKSSDRVELEAILGDHVSALPDETIDDIVKWKSAGSSSQTPHDTIGKLNEYIIYLH